MRRSYDLRRMGFRPVQPSPGKELLAKIAQQFAYDLKREGSTLWLRKHYRRRGIPVPRAFLYGPQIRREHVRTHETYAFLAEYEQTEYAEQQRRIRVPWDGLV